MATKRRRPGTLPPALTPERAAEVERCHPIGVDVASYYARRLAAVGLKPDDLDLFGVAEEAVTLAVCTYTNSHRDVTLDVYVWRRVQSTLTTHLQRTLEERGLVAPSDRHAALRALAAVEIADDYAQTAEDRGDVLRDTREQQNAQYEEEANGVATALVVGAGGHTWKTRGEMGLVMRIEYLRANKALHDEVARLPPAHAMIIELRCFQQLPVEDVAKQAGVSESKVFRVIREAMPLLRARLEARGIKDTSCFEGR
jgi:DNA-directed RNA polymerase specialized sigma24 family protein